MSKHLMGVGDQPAPVPNDAPSAHDLVIADVEQRKQFGLAKYGSLLQPGNTRKSVQDAYEEILDAACYLRTKLEEDAQRTERAQTSSVCLGPRVTVLAFTGLNHEAVKYEQGTKRSVATANGDTMAFESGDPNPAVVAEFGGRACYQSWAKPNPDTRNNFDYLGHILAVGHESILEHATVTLYITGVSRAFTHELIRHRHLSFSQLSQRFVDESGAAMVVPPALAADQTAIDLLAEANVAAQDVYTRLVEHLQARGLERKQAREAARAVLPNMTETRITVTGNLRAWRDVLNRRCAADADAEMRQVSLLILSRLQQLVPAAFQDFINETVDGVVIARKDPDFQFRPQN
ncbi:FAD-dependent thymidylate synthase [Rhodococcus rhodochrous]|uniref:FAD-dependent thymidylate synthase n=1 Tax=Rhodococcus rhodochrous TaxID=1829 RepID=UPI00178522DE|nr:FAD-dependent thymidylate synthase [Rhodococcus rhodochrous]